MKNNTRKILVAFLLVFTMMIGIFSVTSFAEESAQETNTYYFSNNKGWSEVYVYHWVDGGAGTEWPGELATYIGNNSFGERIYSIDVPVDRTHIIFNNGNGEQTVDIMLSTVSDNGFYLDQNTDGKWTVGTYPFSDSNIVGGGDTGNDGGSDAPFVDTHSSYTVAGTAGLCGTEWDTSNTSDDLVLGEDGVYSITYTNVPAGEHKFKVAADHAWDYAWPSSDYAFTLTEACDVTIKFNPQTKKVEVVADKIDTTTPPASDGLYTVAGQSALCGSDWSTSDTYNDMILNPETGLYEKTFTGVPAGFYECKVVLNHSWDVSYGGDSGEFGNYSFTIEEELNVTITFDPVACIVSHYTSESTGAVERPEPEKPDINYDETITIYLSNSANWETPYVYYWTQGAADQNAAWPGVPMEWDGEKLVYYVNVPTYYVNIIFNDGNGTQTADLYIPEDGSIYDNVSNEWGNIKDFTPPAKPENTTTDVTVYVKDDLGWGDVYIYFWDESGIEAAVWPGVAMELGADGYYYYTIPAGFSNVIFNNGGSWEDGSLQQTSDLSIPKDSKVYISNSAENDKGWYGVGGNSGDNNNNNSTDTPVTPETPKAELSFLQKLAYQLLLWLRSIEEFFKNMFVGNKA